ncbi:hypothetical protein GCM10017783_06900 [Deinococcus piscis]|uniref:DUF306 domain-containing protein n=1 Tax=Deinococcus piscis TaxID=394230 RepID=A0ABQ3K0A9_9DEIO|nr:META domain-containing protein [Deinococcus piscis]GHF97634.1 hypothetical protein GCM10017783_06900 [Deinococcus piscis]
MDKQKKLNHVRFNLGGLRCGLLSVALLGLGTAAAQTAPASLAGEWTVVGPDSLLGKGNAAPSLTLDGRSDLSGFAGCNRLSGRYAARGSVFLTSGLAVTRMACDPQAMQLESAVLDRLNRVNRFSLDGELLTLKGSQGDLLLRRSGPALNLGTSLTPAPQEPSMTLPPSSDPATPAALSAVTGAWQVRSLTVGGQSVPVRPEAAVDLKLTGEKLELSGTLGCNRLRSTGQMQPQTPGSDSPEWRFIGVGTTRMACEPELMAAETQLTEFLLGALRLDLSGDTLTLRSAGGELVLERAVPQAAAEWASSYQATQLRLDGQDVSLTLPVTFSFEPQADGTLQLSGDAGCNRLFASGQPWEGGWAFDGLGATLMACPDMSAESSVGALLGESFKLFREGNTLALRSERGELQLAPASEATQPAPAVQPAGQYTLTELRRDGQTLDLSAFDRPVILNFAQDAQGQHTLGGSDGCNTFGGSYEWVAGGGLRLPEPPLGTLMFCPSLDTMPSLSAALADSPDITLTGDRLTLRHGDTEWVFQQD